MHGYTVALWVAFGLLVGGALVVSLLSRGGRRPSRPTGVAEVSG
ncbi:hypothetical protein ACQ4WX_01030 [Streptomyces lasalocidi]